MKRKLIHNRIQCKQCGDIIESFHTHDLKYCKCRKVGIDGGLEYAKRLIPSGANWEEYIEDLSEWKES